jgi:hypothetical protein
MERVSSPEGPYRHARARAEGSTEGETVHVHAAAAVRHRKSLALSPVSLALERRI